MSDLSRRIASKSVFAEQEPQQVGGDGLSRTWITRGGNFAVCYSEVEADAVLERDDNPEEYMLLLPPVSASVIVEASGRSVDAEPESLTIIPPGRSRIVARSAGRIARIFSKASKDVMAFAINADCYSDGAPELAPPDLWPEPRDGYRLRHYPLGQYLKPNGERIQPRCFRSTNMMVNLFGQFLTRRGTKSLSPHWHDDFEQASLCFDGVWVHHLRYNWGADGGEWIPDDHAEVPSVSVTVIPARAIHTSEDVGKDGPESSLYDIFCPPRLDFALKAGFVINEDEYPLPDVKGEQPLKTGGTLLSWQKSA